MKFEKGPLTEVASTVADQIPNFSNQGGVLVSPDPEMKSKIEAEIERKKNLLVHIDTYISKNVAEREKRIAGVERSGTTGDPYSAKLDARRKEMRGRGEAVARRIVELEEMIGVAPTPPPEIPTAEMISVVPPTQTAWPQGVSAYLRESARGVWKGFKRLFGMSDDDTNTGRAERITVLPPDDKPMLPVIEGFGKGGKVDFDTNDVEVTGWGVTGGSEVDPFRSERYVRGGTREAVPMEPDAALAASISKSPEYDEVRLLRDRDRLGFADAQSEDNQKGTIDIDQWLSSKSAEIPITKPFGGASERGFRVEEMSAERALRVVADLHHGYKEVLAAERANPALLGTYEAQSGIIRNAYVDALRTARFALAAEIRGEPEGDRRRELTRHFAAVMGEIRRVAPDIVGEKSEPEEPLIRKAA